MGWTGQATTKPCSTSTPRHERSTPLTTIWSLATSVSSHTGRHCISQRMELVVCDFVVVCFDIGLCVCSVCMCFCVCMCVCPVCALCVCLRVCVCPVFPVSECVCVCVIWTKQGKIYLLEKIWWNQLDSILHLYY